MKNALIIISCFCFIVFVLTNCMNFRKSTKSLEKEFSKTNHDINISYHDFNGQQMRYLHYDQKESLPTLIFVHGAPGSSSSFLPYLKDSSLNNDFNIVVIDRPGYGYSDYGTYYPIATQADWLTNFVEKQFSNTSVFLIGHSFGGPVVSHAAQRLDNKIKGTIMIAPALDPENEKYFFGGKLAYHKPTRWLFSKAWQVSADEKYQHAAELKELEHLLGQIKTPVLHIHGTNDKIAPYVNLSYSQTHFNPDFISIYSWDNQGHLIPFKEQEKTIEIIRNFVAKCLLPQTN